MGRKSKYPAEVRERAVRLAFEQQTSHESEWEALTSIAEKVGCTAETLRKWVRRTQRDAGQRPGLTTGERECLKDLERENRELKRANEILRKASAFLPRRSSTADRSDDRLHRQAPRGARGRADLRGVADRPGDLLRAQGTPTRPGAAPCPHEARRDARPGAVIASASLPSPDSRASAWNRALPPPSV